LTRRKAPPSWIRPFFLTIHGMVRVPRKFSAITSGAPFFTPILYSLLPPPPLSVAADPRRRTWLANFSFFQLPGAFPSVRVVLCRDFLPPNFFGVVPPGVKSPHKFASRKISLVTASTQNGQFPLPKVYSAVIFFPKCCSYTLAFAQALII